MNKQDVLNQILALDPSSEFTMELNSRKELDDELLRLHSILNGIEDEDITEPEEKLIKIIFTHKATIQVGRLESRTFKAGDTYVLPEYKYKQLLHKYRNAPFKSEAAFSMEELRDKRKDKRPKVYLDILTRKQSEEV